MVSYLALVVVAKKRGGTPISYIVYYHEGREKDRSLLWRYRSFFTYEDALKSMHQYDYSEFRPTSGWLHNVSAGGGYEQFPKGTWVRVPSPRIKGRRTRGKNKALQIDDLGNSYRLIKGEVRVLKGLLSEIESSLSCMKLNLEAGYEEDPGELEALRSECDAFSEQLDQLKRKLLNLRCEIEFARARRTGITLSPLMKALMAGTELSCDVAEKAFRSVYSDKLGRPEVCARK